jgi:sulfate adenylyltransferase subunit 1
MVTGASTANAAIILIDARNGVTEQTYRHSYIASLLQIPHLIICVNKMDLMNYSEEVYEKIKHDFGAFAAKLDVKDIHFVPISALVGDNVVDKLNNMPWYEGGTLRYILENIHVASDHNHIDPRFPVQYVIRPISEKYHDYRGYAGRIAGGVFHKGEKVMVLPSGFVTTLESIDFDESELNEAFPPMSVTLRLSDDLENNVPVTGQDIEVMMCWMGEKPLVPGMKYYLRHTTSEVRAMIKEIVYKVDVNTLERVFDGQELKMNEIGRVQLRTTKPLYYDSYRRNRTTGSIILIDEGTFNTVGVGMIV